jgi:hypothetical protein
MSMERQIMSMTIMDHRNSTMFAARAVCGWICTLSKASISAVMVAAPMSP